MFPETRNFEVLGRGFEVGAYSWCVVFAAATVLLGGLWTTRGLSRVGTVSVLVSAMAAALVGSRVLNLLVNSSEPFSWDRVFDPHCSHFSLYGGLLAGGGTAAIVAGAARLSLWRLADAMTVPLAAGIAIARLGCFFRGCCFGLECDQPWGVVVPRNSPAHLFQMVDRPFVALTGPAPVHPTQLYEIGAATFAAFVALGCRRRNAPPGVGFLSATICFTSLRWLNLLFRASVYSTASNRWFYPILYSAILIVSAIAILSLLRASHESSSVSRPISSPLVTSSRTCPQTLPPRHGTGPQHHTL